MKPTFKQLLMQYVASPLAELGYTYDPKLYQVMTMYGFSKQVTLPNTGPVWCKVLFQRYSIEGVQFTIFLWRSKTHQGEQEEDKAYRGRLYDNLPNVLYTGLRLPQYENNHFWWIIPDEKDVADVGKVMTDAVNMLVTHGIPWLEDETNSWVLGEDHHRAYIEAIETIVAPRLRVVGYELAYQPDSLGRSYPHLFKRLEEHITAHIKFYIIKAWCRPDSQPYFHIQMSRELAPTAPAVMLLDRSRYELRSGLNELLANKAYALHLSIKPIREAYHSFDELRSAMEYATEALLTHGVPWIDNGFWNDYPTVTSDKRTAWLAQA